MDIIDRGDLLYLVGVTLILLIIGNAYAGPTQRRCGGLCALLVFLGYLLSRVENVTSAGELYNTALRASIMFGMTLGVGWIVFTLLTPIIAPIVEAVQREKVERKLRDEAMKARKAEDERRRDAEERHRKAMEKPPPLPRAPSPTQEEVIQTAKERYDRTLQALEGAGLDGIEMKAARQQAKKRYLTDLNEVLR